MRKHFLLFMALFAFASVNNLFASGEASSHTTDGTINPTTQTSLVATSLPFTLSDWNAEKFASNVWVPNNDKNLVTWSASDTSFLFAGKDLDSKYNDNECEQPFVIKLAGAAKQLTIQSGRATSTVENQTGLGWKVYEWDGTKWNNIYEKSWITDAKTLDLKSSTRYVMIAAYSHGGGNRKFAKFEITKGDAGLSADKNALAFSTTNITAQTVTVLNAYSGNQPSAAWKAGSTDKFEFKKTSQSGTADDGQTVFSITPKSGAVAGDNDVLVVSAGNMSVEIPVVVYDATDKSLPINLTSGGSVADAARFIGMCTHNKTSYDFATKSITFFGGQSYAADVRSVIFPISDAPSMLSYTITANQEGQQWSGYQKPKITTFQSTDGSTWMQAGELKDFNGTENVDLELKSTTRYIKLEFSGIKGVGTLTNLKITKADPIPTMIWNIGTILFERNDYSDIFKTNSDAQLTITVNSPNSLLSYANGKLTTAAIASSPQSAGSITVSAPATATFQSFETTLENIQLVSNPAYLPAIVNSKDVFDLLFSGQSAQDVSPNAQWNSELGVIELLRRSTSNDRYFELTIKGVPYQLSFDYKNDESSDWGGDIEMWIKESVDGTTWTDVKTGIKPSNLSEYTPFGPYDLSSTTTKIRVYVKGTYAQHLFKNLTIISASPMLNVAESVVALKANTSQVFDNTINFSVLKYQTITAKIEGAGFSLVKGDDTPTSEITFSSLDGLNNSTFQDCSFKVRYSGDASSAVGETAAIKFYGDGNMDTEIGSVAVSVIAMPRLTFEVPTNGSYTYQYQGESVVTINEQKTRELIDAPYEVTLTANANVEGYKFFGWYEKNGENKTYLSNSATFVTSIETTKTIGAEFVSSTTPIFIIKGQSVPYANLNAAVAAAQTDDIIVLISDGILPAGDYTIPANKTLLIPFESTYKCYTNEPEASHGHARKVGTNTNDYKADSSFVYRMLTLDANAHLLINGVLSLSADRWCIFNTGKNGSGQYASLPNVSGDFRTDLGYGMIDMKANSSIVVKNNAKLYCWGRIRGEGVITAESGSEVRESFVFTDRRDEDRLKDFANNSKCFPMHQNYIQDIQVPITYEYGSRCILVTGVFVTKSTPVYKGTMNFIGNNGSNSLIELKNGSSFKKTYDVKSDCLIFDLYNGASFNNFKMSVSGYGNASTETHIFTINNNWRINVNSGETHIAHDLAFAAGAQLNINSGANVIVDQNASVYVYDKDDWGEFSSGRKILPLFLPSYELKNKSTSYDGVTLYDFSANTTYKAIRRAEDLQDASIMVNGTLTIKGGTNAIYNSNSYGGQYKVTANSGLYTTLGKANIYSNGSGSIIFEQGAGTQDHIHQQKGYGYDLYKIAIEPAQLMNADGTYTSSAGFETATQFTYTNGYWVAEEIQATTITIDNGKVKIDDADPEVAANSTYSVENAQMVEAETITVNAGSTLDVQAGGAVVATNLILSTTPSAIDAENGKAGVSSQVLAEGSVNATNVFIDITMDPNGNLDGSKYYAFAVPFVVNVDGGIQRNINGVLSPAVMNQHYRAYTYNGQNRAENGKGSNWVAVASNGTFQPGVFYLVEFADGSCNTFRFTKATGEALNNAANINLEEYGNGTPNSPDAGWNGIANNSLQNATITLNNAGLVQIFDPAQSKFVTVELNATVFAVGTPLFIQAAGADVTATNSAVSQPSSAPARMLAQTDDETFGNYTIRIAAENATKMADQLFISASENASSNYVIGKDLTKMFMGNASVAQLWVNDYGKKLSVNQAVLTENVANASLTLYAPKAGNYKVYLKTAPEDATLYLLENGNAIANLNDGEYVVSLAKGENKQYGIRINTAKSVPSVVTSLDEALVGADLQKVLMNGVVYIIRDGKLYNMLGQER